MIQDKANVSAAWRVPLVDVLMGTDHVNEVENMQEDGHAIHIDDGSTSSS